jgi:pilus assembly protein Flp/PilA
MYSQMLRQVAEFLKREDGPTAVEYAVMLSLIIVICLAAIAVLGRQTSSTFTSVGNTIGSGS